MNVSNASQTHHFDELSSQWWDESGAFGVLHAMNPKRIEFIKQLAETYFQEKGLQGLKALDVGCGGGIACEPLARLGANVTGIDASEASIKVAKEHAVSQNLEINYACTDIKDLNDTFDLITCLEVVEHVEDLPKFATDLVKRLNINGLLVLSTINRTWFSYLVGIVGAEYLTRKIPVGTHDWQKFIEPAKLVELFESLWLKTVNLKGLNYSVLCQEWKLGKDLKMNYLAGFLKV